MARHADAWLGLGTPASLRETSARLDRLAEEAGRDPASIVRSSSLSLSEPADAVRRVVDAWRDGGFTYLVCGWPSEGRDRVAEMASMLIDT